MSEKGGGGFPYIAMLDASGDVLGVHNGARSVEGFQETVDKTATFVALREKAEAGDEKAKVEVFLAQLDMSMTHDKAVATLAEVKKLAAFGEIVDDAKMAEISQKLVNLEVNDVVSEIKTGSEEEMATAAGKLLAIKEAGKSPDGQAAFAFWQILLGHAQRQGDVEMVKKLAEEWIATMDEDDPREGRMITSIRGSLERVIAEMESGGDEDGDK